MTTIRYWRESLFRCSSSCDLLIFIETIVWSTRYFRTSQWLSTVLVTQLVTITQLLPSVQVFCSTKTTRSFPKDRVLFVRATAAQSSKQRGISAVEDPTRNNVLMRCSICKSISHRSLDEWMVKQRLEVSYDFLVCRSGYTAIRRGNGFMRCSKRVYIYAPWKVFSISSCRSW
jgi:hypothetical protein